MIKTTQAQRCRKVGTSVAIMKAATIGRTFDIPTTTVRGIIARYRWTLGTSRNVPISFSILQVSSDDMPTEILSSWCCGTFPIISYHYWSPTRATWTLGGILTRSSILQEKQPSSCTTEPRPTIRKPSICCAEKLRKFWISKTEMLIWIWSKMCGTSSNNNKTIPTSLYVMWRIKSLGFTWYGMTSPKHPSAVPL